MGVRFLTGVYDAEHENPDRTVLVDSVSGHAFGPLFDTPEDAQAFLDWFGSASADDARGQLGLRAERANDPRAYSDHAIELLVIAWKRDREKAAA